MIDYSIGVDLGGTNLRTAAMWESGELLETLSLATRLADGRDEVISDLCHAVNSLLDRNHELGNCVGIGVGTPGPLDLPAGILRRPPNLPGWDGFDVRTAIEQKLRRPIYLDSDANLAALAELHFGAGKDYAVQSLCMLTLGTGVGNGIVLDGHIWQGMRGMAGEAGHMTVVPDGAPCGCGSHGCLEQYASATAIRRMAQERAQEQPTLAQRIATNPGFGSHDVAQWAEQGDAGAQAVFDEMGRCLGLALAALVNTLNLPLYVIGGGSAAAWPLFQASMMEELRVRSYVFRATEPNAAECAARAPERTYIVPASLGPESGLQGAALLPFVERSKNV